MSGDYAFCEKAQLGELIFQGSFLLMLLQNLSESIVKTESQAINSISAEYWPNVHDHCIDPKGIGLRVCILASVGSIHCLSAYETCTKVNYKQEIRIKTTFSGYL